MLTSRFNYFLPKELIAQSPISPRDHSRLLVVNRKNKAIEHRHFFNILDYLQKGDLLVWNNSKVFKARLFGQLESLNGEKLFEHEKPIEVFLVRPMENVGVWKALAKPGRHVIPGTKVKFATDFECEVILKEKDGTILVQFPHSTGSRQADDADVVRQKANKYGHIPVPPYVKKEPAKLETYQTIYAQKEGSVAAPTAGFHFTPELIEKLSRRERDSACPVEAVAMAGKNKGIEFAEVTLHVGLGTFQPVKTENIEEHKMHSEYVELDEKNAEKINRAKREGRRVIAVGTTTVRTLEGICLKSEIRNPPPPKRGPAMAGKSETNSKFKIQNIKSYSGEIDLFIMPGFRFQVVDALITNFHLPKSTLLMLVSAFIGDVDRILQIYQEAVELKYRFYSFGDAMLIM